MPMQWIFKKTGEREARVKVEILGKKIDLEPLFPDGTMKGMPLRGQLLGVMQQWLFHLNDLFPDSPVRMWLIEQTQFVNKKITSI